MSRKQTLPNQLKSLKQKSKQVEERFQSARRELWDFLAHAYGFYVEANKTKGWLEKQYTKQGITAQQRDTNHQKFYPFLKLFNEEYKAEHLAAKLGGYVWALAAIEEKEKQAPFIFKSDRVGAAADFLRELGGVNPAKVWLSQELSETGGDVVADDWVMPPSPIRQLKASANQKAKADINRIATAKLRNIHERKSLANIDIGDFPTHDNTALLIATKRADGTFDIVATAFDEDLVKAAVDEAVTVPLVNDTPIFSTLFNMLRLHSVPRAIQMRGARNKFFRDSGKTNADGKKLYETVRVVALKDGSLLASKVRARSNSSLVTIAKPKSSKQLDKDYFLRGSDRYFLETQLLLESDVVNFKVVGRELSNTSEDVVAEKQITIEQLTSKNRRNLYFYPIAAVEDEGIETQPFQLASKQQWDWTLTLTPNFMNAVFRQHLLKWMDSINKRINTRKNDSMQIVVTDKGLLLRSEYDKVSDAYTRFQAADVLVEFSDRDRVTFTNDYKFKVRNAEYAKIKVPNPSNPKEKIEIEPNTIKVSPSDIYMLFEALSTASSSIKIMGNGDVMFVEHKDDNASYKTYIPSTDGKGVRKGSLFTTLNDYYVEQA